MTTKGQALIEMAMFVLLSTSLIGAFLGFTKSFLIRQELLLAAREGMLLYSSGHFTIPEVKDRINTFLAGGSPALVQEQIQVMMGHAGDAGAPNPIGTLQATLVGLDYITVRYTTNSTWIQQLLIDPTMEETCYIKHANGYGPSIPALWGPPVRP